MKKLIQNLNNNLADLNILYIKLHQFHWLVNGPGFFVVHTKLEETYDELHELLDVVAERIVGLHEVPYSTSKQYQANSKIKEIEDLKDYSAKNLVKLTIADLDYMTEALKETIALADELGDVATSDAITPFVTQLEQHRWMYCAFLGE